jgi:tetratricopeptide (TPR) repeat protein
VNRRHGSANLNMTASQIDRRGDAWELGLNGDYDAALGILEELLDEAPADVVSLRMKGNLLELKVLDLLEHSAKKLSSSAEYLAARRCYERILELDPRNVTARIDLGDHYKNLGANDKALEYYREAASALQRTPNGSTWKQDVRDLLERVTQLAKHDRLAGEAKSLEAWCRQALGAPE